MKHIAKSKLSGGVDDPFAEMQALHEMSQSNHPNVVSLVCIAESAENFYFFLEDCGSDFMDHMLGQMGRKQDERPRAAHELLFSTREKKHVFKQILLGVQHIHSCGYAHLDLSLENCMAKYGADGNLVVKVIDFGLSRRMKQRGDSALPGTRVPKSSDQASGKLPYIAPEILSVHLVQSFDGAAADVWACGRILLELLRGYYDHLWTMASDQDMHFEAFTAAPDMKQLVELVPGLCRISPESRSLACAMLNTNPAMRPRLSPELLSPEWEEANEERNLAAEVGSGSAPSIDAKIRAVLTFTEQLLLSTARTVDECGTVNGFPQEFETAKHRLTSSIEAGPFDYSEEEHKDEDPVFWYRFVLQEFYVRLVIAGIEGSKLDEDSQKELCDRMYEESRGPRRRKTTRESCLMLDGVQIASVDDEEALDHSYVHCTSAFKSICTPSAHFSLSEQQFNTYVKKLKRMSYKEVPSAVYLAAAAGFWSPLQLQHALPAAGSAIAGAAAGFAFAGPIGALVGGSAAAATQIFGRSERASTAKLCQAVDCEEQHRFADGYCHLHRQLARQ
jgi:serine/threonine protein kinase